ncbi:hypothetical protein KORDIASMS9_02677 [Kordia sp. SMS9]|uniref:DUF2586 family protein n=1 Tax=Kordia sp. SMS9 TaxID=2282170 RepID=UPI000E0DA82B|nr:DUF2586 family protein [Kordia sp. SMS9]AXG70437.1 hypothetical protein KORDIASMS9_02677 [Kordia sp. SMS9]
MADLDGVDLRKGKIGANTISKDSGISGMVFASVSTTELPYKTVEEVYNLTDVEALGITEEYDATNGVTVYRQINEFYRMASEGQKLYIMLVDRVTRMVDILEDPTEAMAKKLLIHAKGEIRQLAISVNSEEDIIYLNGMPDDVYNSIAKAQALAKWAFEMHFPCQILLEGYGFSGNAASCISLRDLPNLQATKVSVVIGQDWNHADTLENNGQLYADVGTALGTLAVAKVGQNIGDNEVFDLTDGALGKWLIPGLSSHQKNIDAFSGLQTLEDKGYVFGFAYVGMEGVRWNNDHVCAPIIRDQQGNVNEHTMSYGKLLDHATRELRRVLLKKLKTKHPVDSKTGKLPIGVVKNFEKIGNEVFEKMEKAGQISSGTTIVSRDSDLIVAKTLNVKFRVVPFGSVDDIKGTINLKTQV